MLYTTTTTTANTTRKPTLSNIDTQTKKKKKKNQNKEQKIVTLILYNDYTSTYIYRDIGGVYPDGRVGIIEVHRDEGESRKEMPNATAAQGHFQLPGV